MTQALEGEGGVYSPSSLAKTGVYKQKIQSNLKIKEEDNYDQDWALWKCTCIQSTYSKNY